MSLLIKGMEMPKNCMECEWRDAEACGECELMIGNPFKSFAEQYAHCPFQMMAKRHALVIIPPHGRLIDKDALEYDISHGVVFSGKLHNPEIIGANKIINRIHHAPTIIGAEENA